MSHVFVSYAREDLGFVRRLVKDLEAAGLNIWFDEKHIPTGADRDAATRAGLEEAAYVLVVISPDAMGSSVVQQAVNFARDNDQIILPVVSRFAPVMPALETLDWVDLSSNERYTLNLSKLVALWAGRTPDVVSASSTFSNVPVEVAQGRVVVPYDMRHIIPYDLRRYLGILAVVAAPYASNGGESPPQMALDGLQGWQKLAAAVAHAQGVPLALTRLNPPIADHLVNTLAAGNEYPIVHLVCHSANDVFILEDEWGHEAPLYPQPFINLFRDSAVQLVVMDSPISEPTAHFLLEETVVKALIGTSKQPSASGAAYFARHFYGGIATQQSVRDAFDAATSALRETFPDDVACYQLWFKPELDNLRLDFPPETMRASRSLIDPGLPPMRNVPQYADFIGQRAPLSELSQEIASTSFRQIAIYGSGGAGKSWLAAEYAARFGWRYPDGVLWMNVSDRTKSEDVVEQLLALLELPADTNWATLRDILRERQVLVVLDQVDAWGDPLEIGELADFVSRLDNIGGTRFLLTAYGPVQPITYTSGTEENTVETLLPDEAERLALQLIADYDLQSEFPDDDAVAAFVEHTGAMPWLIHAGTQMVRRQGLSTTLTDLAELTGDVADAYDIYMRDQLETLPEDALNLVRRLKGLPDSFTREMAVVIGGESTQDQLRVLVQRGLLGRVGRLYHIPAAIRYFLRQTLSLSDLEQDEIDQSLIEYMLRITP